MHEAEDAQSVPYDNSFIAPNTKFVQPTLKLRVSMAYESINPYNGKRSQQFAEHTSAEVETAVARAQTCFTTWQTKTFAERAAVLSKSALILRSRAEEFAGLITMEMGKLIAECHGEVAIRADLIA